MKFSSLLSKIFVALAAFCATAAFALLTDTHWTAQVGDVEVVTDDAAHAAIYVRGVFAPALPCPIQGFVLVSTDPYQKEMFSMILMAKATGRPITFTHTYCFTSGPHAGYSRGNGIVLQ